ncbi:MAG: M3 family peptidase, partial [Gemmatimonadaceae bacterium]
MLPQIPTHRVAAHFLLGITLACAPVVTTTTRTPSPADVVAAASENPLLQGWTGQYGGVPPFASISIADFKPALETAMAEELAEVERIANDPAPPTFENTLAALERTGRKLDRVTTAYGIWSSTMNTSEFQPIEREMAPKLAGHSDRITQNAALFRR